jgi:hypothetical protein
LKDIESDDGVIYKLSCLFEAGGSNIEKDAESSPPPSSSKVDERPETFNRGDKNRSDAACTMLV